MSAKSFLSSLMADSTRAWSCFVSVTYARLDAAFDRVATRTARGTARKEPQGEVEAAAWRLAVRSVHDAMLDIVVMNVMRVRCVCGTQGRGEEEKAC